MRPPECPRCGYDLSGKLEGYRGECPLGDVCSECGCEFRWSAILGELAMPRWWVEHPRVWLGRSAVPTIARLFVPGVFWRDVQMEHQPRWRRALLVPILVYVLAGAVIAASQGWAIWDSVQRIAARPAWAQPQFETELQVARVVRGAMFPFATTEYFPGILQRWRTGRWQGWWGDLSVETLIDIRPRAETVTPLVAGLAVIVLFLVPMQTRKRYKVLPWHVWRIGIYGMAGCIGIAFLTVLLHDGADTTTSWSRGSTREIRLWTTILVTLIWLGWWWGAASSSYLRIEAYRSFAWPLVGVACFAGVTAQAVYAIARDGGMDGIAFIPGASLFW